MTKLSMYLNIWLNVQNWCISNLESYGSVRVKISGQLNVKHLDKITLKIQCALILHGKVCVILFCGRTTCHKGKSQPVFRW